MAKKAAPAVDPESATTQVNIADFQRTRDSVIVALATLQSSVQDLSRAYINHANTVLTTGRGGELNANLTNILSDSGLLGATALAAPVLEDAAAALEGKKKRKRVPHDPNAPKRALTPYFLYMQSARQQIAKELGENAKPKEVADEGTRRWSEMPAAEKAVWDQQYQQNLAVYRVRMAAYKSGQEVPDDEQAARLVDVGKVTGLIPAADDPEPEISEESSPEPVKEPTPPKSKRRKSEKAASPVKETPKTKAAEKKSKKAKKESSPAPEVPASTSKASEKKKRSKKA